ncbi:MAG: hypothetical protein ACKOB6_09745 [Candidatus Kapaibacterium sp.]
MRTTWSRILAASLAIVWSVTAGLPALADQPHCLRYGFLAGDSVVFRLTSRDTLEFETRIARERTELYSYVCDHVTEKGERFLRVTLESAVVRETQTDGTSTVTDTSFRSRSPWIGRTAYIILDSNGKRTLARLLDTDRTSVSPGGAFQPTLLLLGVDTACHDANRLRSWVIKTTDTLAENAWPAPVVRSTFSCAMIDSVLDGRPVTTIRYAQTGQGSFKSIANEMGVVLYSVLDGFGSYVIDARDGLPIEGDLKLRSKITVMMERSTTKGNVRHDTSFRRIYSSRP